MGFFFFNFLQLIVSFFFSLFSDAMTYPDPDPLISQNSLEYYGQRPWRPGKVSIEPPDMELEQKGISALLFRERNLKPTHSEVIVELFKKAIGKGKKNVFSSHQIALRSIF